MDDFLFAFTGVILQVLGLFAVLNAALLEVVKLILTLILKENPRSSDKEDPR